MLLKMDPEYLLPPRIKDLSTNGDSSNSAKLAQKPGWNRPVSSFTNQTRSTKRSVSPNSHLEHLYVETDFAYWLKLTVFNEQDPKHFPLTSSGLTSPYLTIVFDDIPFSMRLPMGLPTLSKDTRILYVEHKLAVHGATALYNLWHALTNKETGPILHFGITISTICWFHVFTFEPIKTTKHDWAGCDMIRIASGKLTIPLHLQELVDIYSDIQGWGVGVYAERLRKVQ
jgi:hypothetical protein